MSIERAVLEEVARRVIDDGLELTNKSNLSDFEEGLLFAYFDILDWTKQQAELNGIEFDDGALQAFDPYTLLVNKEP